MDSNKNNTAIGQRIYKLRLANNETQTALQNAVGVSTREMVNHWESGSREVKASYLIAIAEHYGVSTDYLLGLTDVANTNSSLRASAEYLGLDEGPATFLAEMKQGNSYSLKLINALLKLTSFYRATNCLEMVSILERSKTEEDRKNPSAFNERCKAIDSLNTFGLINGMNPDASKFSLNKQKDLYKQQAIDYLTKAIDYIVEHISDIDEGGI